MENHCRYREHRKHGRNVDRCRFTGRAKYQKSRCQCCFLFNIFHGDCHNYSQLQQACCIRPDINQNFVLGVNIQCDQNSQNNEESLSDANDSPRSFSMLYLTLIGQDSSGDHEGPFDGCAEGNTSVAFVPFASAPPLKRHW